VATISARSRLYSTADMFVHSAWHSVTWIFHTKLFLQPTLHYFYYLKFIFVPFRFIFTGFSLHVCSNSNLALTPVGKAFTKLQIVLGKCEHRVFFCLFVRPNVCSMKQLRPLPTCFPKIFCWKLLLKFVEKIKCQLESKNKNISNEDRRTYYYS